MEKLICIINGLNINYIQNKQEGNPIVFVHGNSLSSQSFIKQFKDPILNDNYRLIAIDLPGHGESDQAKEPEKTYSFSGFIDILLSFIDKLNLHNAVFVGHSLGGHLLLDASENLSLAKGFVIFGTPPINIPPDMGKYFLPNPVFPLVYKPDLNSEEIKNLASAFVNDNTEALEIITKDIKRTHQEMRAYLGASLTPQNLSNEVETIENLNKPIAIFHGKDDKLVNGKYYKELNIPTLWQNEVKTISDSGHCPQLESPVRFNKILFDFLFELQN